MPNPQNPVQAYLERIGFTGTPRADLPTLQQLQYCHLHTVPYENLDLLLGRDLQLDTDSLFDKIVARRRGGYCFETNNLYGWLLTQLGFEVRNHFGRIMYNQPHPTMRRHWVLTVTLAGQRYFTDVGVAMSQPRWPLALVEMQEQTRGGETYRVRREDRWGWVVDQLHPRDGWKPYICFTDDYTMAPDDYLAASYYCEKSPASQFNKREMLGIRTAAGRTTLDGRVLKQFTPEGVIAHPLETLAEYKAALKTHFGLDLPEADQLFARPVQ